MPDLKKFTLSDFVILGVLVVLIIVSITLALIPASAF